MDLYGDGDFITQIDTTHSIAASMQVMTNIMREGWDRRNATQRTMLELARSLSPQPLDGAGAEPEGWAAGLDQLGYGPYVVDVQATLEDALKTAARQMRFTNRPVGLLVWRGAHTWVLSGFEADADPAFTDEFTVTGFHVQDVWHPKTSRSWGNRPAPDTLVSMEQLEIEFLPWKRPSKAYPDKDGKYVLILPTLPAAQ